MSFAWKMILAVSLLLALSLSLGGAAVVDRAFRTELDAACRNAEEDMQLFGMTLEALCLNRPVSDTAYEAGEMVRKLVEDSQALSHYEYAVLNPAGIPVVETPGIVTGGIEPGELGVIRVGVATVEDRRHVVAVEKVMLAGESFVLKKRLQSRIRSVQVLQSPGSRTILPMSTSLGSAPCISRCFRRIGCVQ